MGDVKFLLLKKYLISPKTFIIICIYEIRSQRFKAKEKTDRVIQFTWLTYIMMKERDSSFLLGACSCCFCILAGHHGFPLGRV